MQPIKLKTKEQRAKEQHDSNARERQIAKLYLQAGPSIQNLYNAFVHWYNSVPFLGGQPETGVDYITGNAPDVGIKNIQKLIKTARIAREFDDTFLKGQKIAQKADKLYESFVRKGRKDLAIRMLDDKAKRVSPVVTTSNGEIQPLYRGDTNRYNIINENSKNPVFASTDKNYAEMYTSKRKFYDVDPEDDYSMLGVDLSDINPLNLREYYGFGRVFNAAPHGDINHAEALSFFKTNDYLVNEKLANLVWDKYFPLDGGSPPLDEDYRYFSKAVKSIRRGEEIPNDVPKDILMDALAATANESVDERNALSFIRSGRVQWKSNKKNPNGYFRKKDIGERPKNDGSYEDFIAHDRWYKNSFDDIKIKPLRDTRYDGISGRDIPLHNDIYGWRESKGREFGFRNSNNLKLRDITYDDNGNLIPLSLRLNLENPDIRFILPYTIAGGTGYGLYNNFEK